MIVGKTIFYVKHDAFQAHFIVTFAFAVVDEIYEDGSMLLKVYNKKGKEAKAFRISKTEVKKNVRTSWEGLYNLLDKYQNKEEQRIEKQYQQRKNECNKIFKDIDEHITGDGLLNCIKGTNKAKDNGIAKGKGII
jgi:hypothetical protein